MVSIIQNKNVSGIKCVTQEYVTGFDSLQNTDCSNWEIFIYNLRAKTWFYTLPAVIVWRRRRNAYCHLHLQNKTLVSLDLRHFSVKGFSFSSIGFGFPSLKTLWLSDIYFTQDRDFILLLLGCPVLEDLKLFCIYLNYDEEDSLAIKQFKSLSLPKLIRADITQCVCYYFPLKVLSTSESMCLDIFMLYTKDSKVDQVSFIMNAMHATSI